MQAKYFELCLDVVADFFVLLNEFRLPNRHRFVEEKSVDERLAKVYEILVYVSEDVAIGPLSVQGVDVGDHRVAR